MIVILQAMLCDPIFALLAMGQFISYIGIGYTTYYCVTKMLQGE